MMIQPYFLTKLLKTPSNEPPQNGENPIISQFFNFIVFGVIIHPDVSQKILRHMVKELAFYDLQFLSYGKKTVIYWPFLKKMAKKSVFWP